MKLKNKLMNLKSKAEMALSKFTMNYGLSGLRKALLCSGISATAIVNAMASADAGDITTKVTNVITSMVNIVTLVVSGVGVLFLIIAIFNWVSAIKQDEPERAAKGPQNVIIAVLMCLVKPITMMILGSLGLEEDFGLGSGGGGLD